MKIGDLVRFNIEGLEMYLGILVARKGMMWEVLWNGFSVPAAEHAVHLELTNENR